MIGRPLFELETPALCLDLRVLQQRIRTIAHRLRARGKGWRPRAEWHLIPEISRLQCEAGAQGISIDSLSQATRFAGANLTTIHLSQPPVGTRLLRDFLRSYPDLDLSVSCDHYAQAEGISDAAQQMGRRFPVLVELNIGRNRSGVRPGLDGRDLARGLSRLPGIKVCGIDANLGTLDGTGRSQRSSQSALGMLEELQQHFQRDGIGCDLVSVGVEGDIELVLASEVVTDVRTGHFFAEERISPPEPFLAQPIDREVSSPLLSVVTSVFSRSKLERGVLNVGRARLAVRTLEALQVRMTASRRPLPDAKIEHLDWESLTLHLGPASRDIIIGDKITVELRDGTFALRLFPEIYAVQDGIVREVWKTGAG